MTTILFVAGLALLILLMIDVHTTVFISARAGRRADRDVRPDGARYAVPSDGGARR